MITDQPIPKINVGRYAGTPIDQLPNSYLRWMLTQNFPADWLQCAKKKLEQSDYNDIHLNISRHAIDMFSKRFLFQWIQSENDKGDDGDGLGTYIAKRAEEAWDQGIDISKHRHQDDGIIKEYKGIKWIFNVSSTFPDFRDVITIIPMIDE